MLTLKSNRYGRAEAVNAVYLKRLDDAIRDGDPIRSIIRGTAVNSNGRTHGIAQPSIEGQIAVAQKAYDQAGLDPLDTAYVEMHGTGTAVGDVMVSLISINTIHLLRFSSVANKSTILQESESVAKVFLGRPRSNPLLVGGMKPNLGHSEAASGLSSVIKATLALERKQLPPTMGVVNLNPKLRFEGGQIQLVQKSTPFPAPGPGLNRRISVNSFGFGGANAHSILEEAGSYDKFAASCLQDGFPSYDGGQGTLDCTRPYLLPFSANNTISLERRVEQLAHLHLRTDVMADLAYTLGERRSHLKARGFVVARPKTLHQDLNTGNLQLASSTTPILSASHKFIHVFTGQGAQWQGMAEELLQIPVFANAVSQMDEILASLPHHPPWTIHSMLQDKSEKCPINEAAVAQPMTTAVQIGLVELLRALQIPTHGVIGHSSGEISAAYAANMLDMREAISLAYYRGYAVTKCAAVGAMAAVGLSPDKAEEWIQEYTAKTSQVRVACINSPESVTISGDLDGIDSLISSLTAEGIFARKLKTGGKAYHSHQMEPVGATYESLIRAADVLSTVQNPRGNTSLKHPQSCMLSTVLRQQVKESDVRTPAYWRHNLQSPVYFSDGLLEFSALWDDFCFVEVGPHSAMKMPILQTLGKSTPYFGTLRRGQDSISAILELAGSLFISEYPVSFSDLQAVYPRSAYPPKVLHDLPPYPWHYEEILWNESRTSRESRERSFPRHELLGMSVPGGNLITLGWRNQLSLDHVPWMRDHKLGDSIVFPATAYLSMAVEALLQANGVEMWRDLTEFTVIIQNVNLTNALPIAEQEFVELYTELSPREISNLSTFRDWYDFQIASIVGKTPTIRARGTIKLETTPSTLSQQEIPHADFPLTSKSQRMWYESMQKCGLRYGSAFQHMKEIRTPAPETKDTFYAEAKLENVRPKFQTAQESPRYLVHPTILDNALQAAFVASTAGHLNLMVARVPTSFNRIVLKAPSLENNEGTIRAVSSTTGFGSNDVNSCISDPNGKILMHINNMRGVKYSGGDELDEVRHPLYRFVWKPDIDQIPDDASFATALDYVRLKTDLELVSDAGSRDIIMAMDLAVHKDPNADILFLSSDLSLASLVLGEILKAQTGHRRFNSFQFGQFTSDGQLKVAELENFASPIGMDSVPNFVAAPSDGRFGLIILTERTPTPHLDRLASYINESTRILDSSNDDGESLTSKKFTVTHTLPSGSGGGVRIIRPVPKDQRLASHQFSKAVLISRTPSHQDDDYLRERLMADLCLPVDKYELTELGSVDISSTTLIVSTVELDCEVMARPTPCQYEAIQKILAKPVQLVWISGSGLGKDGDPTRAVFHGLARAIMIEQPATEIFCLELDPQITPTDISQYVARLVTSTRPEGCLPDYEYLQSTSGLLVSRSVPDERMNNHFRSKEKGIAVPESLASAGPVSLSMAKPGQLDSVQFVKTLLRCLGPEEVLVQVSWIGLNAKDVYALAGKVDIPGGTCSSEFTGRVLAIGSTVQDLAVNDHVAVLYPSRFGSHEVVPAINCVKLRADDDLRSFSSVLVVFATALYALDYRARLQPGESVLIHSAAGGTGIAAIQLAKMLGAEIFATVGTEEKRQYLIDNFGLQSDHIFNSRTSGLTAQIHALTNGRGVDVVLNSLVGELLLESWECLAEFGRFVEIGKKDITDHGRLPMDHFKRCVTFTAFDLGTLGTSKSPAIQRVFHQLISRVVALVREGDILPPPLTSFTAAELGVALRHFNSPARTGKITISFEDPKMLIPVVPDRFTTKLHPCKSYLMVGCLGGLGRSLSQWMINRGARSFIFLGRSGKKKPAAQRLIEDLEQQGAQCLVIQGDVTNAEDVERAISAAPLPLGGVVHAAMGLHEAIFSEMKYDYWREGTAAKIEGAWNLHNALSKFDREKDLDFFVLTSSINGKVGTATEGNYCAANHFLDVFARYRRMQGRTAISIGLGAIAEIGYLHEHSHIEELLLRKGFRFLTESDVLQIFDLALSAPPTSAHSGDILTQSLLLSGVEVTTLKQHHQQGFKTFWHTFEDARFSIIINALKRSSGITAGEGGNTHESALRSAVASKDKDLVLAAVQATITQKLSHMVLVPFDEIKVQASLSIFGMDSMLASEFRQHIFSLAKVDVSFLTIMSPQTSVSTLSSMVASALLDKPQ